MRRALVLPVIGSWLVSGLTGPVAAQPVASDDPIEVTTDTPQYCSELAVRLHNMVQVAVIKPPREVSSLSDEGKRMCAHGQTRGGIMRLRMALLLMMQDETPRK